MGRHGFGSDARTHEIQFTMAERNARESILKAERALLDPTRQGCRIALDEVMWASRFLGHRSAHGEARNPEAPYDPEYQKAFNRVNYLVDDVKTEIALKCFKR